MATFDTNVVVRIIVKDDPEQCLLAEGVWRSALESGGVFLPKIVIVEVAWVLRSAYRYDRLAVAAALRGLTEVEGVRVEDEDEIRRAIEQYEQGGAGFSDCLLREAAATAGALPVFTFDQGFAQEPDVVLVGSPQQPTP
jgi:predicted nucleic-acid-binding protein